MIWSLYLRLQKISCLASRALSTKKFTPLCIITDIWYVLQSILCLAHHLCTAYLLSYLAYLISCCCIPTWYLMTQKCRKKLSKVLCIRSLTSCRPHPFAKISLTFWELCLHSFSCQELDTRNDTTLTVMVNKYLVSLALKEGNRERAEGEPAYLFKGDNIHIQHLWKKTHNMFLV